MVLCSYELFLPPHPRQSLALRHTGMPRTCLLPSGSAETIALGIPIFQCGLFCWRIWPLNQSEYQFGNLGWSDLTFCFSGHGYFKSPGGGLSLSFTGSTFKGLWDSFPMLWSGGPAASCCSDFFLVSQHQASTVRCSVCWEAAFFSIALCPAGGWLFVCCLRFES